MLSMRMHALFQSLPPVPQTIIQAHNNGFEVGLLLPLVGIPYGHYRLRHVSCAYSNLHWGNTIAAERLLADMHGIALHEQQQKAFCTAYIALREALGDLKTEKAVLEHEKECDAIVQTSGLTRVTHNNLVQKLTYDYNFWDGMISGSATSTIVLVSIGLLSYIKAYPANDSAMQ